MTRLTLAGRGNMWCGFAMAVGAHANDLGMIDRLWRNRYPRCRKALMARVADRGCGNMRRAAPRGHRAIMTTKTIPSDKATVIGNMRG